MHPHALMLAIARLCLMRTPIGLCLKPGPAVSMTSYTIFSARSGKTHYSCCWSSLLVCVLCITQSIALHMLMRKSTWNTPGSTA